MPLSRARMLDRTFAKDAGYDRRFIVGVVSTGIFCVPSCPAPKPKPTNIRFFEGPEPATEAGLRACKRCRPVETYAGLDADELAFERLAEAVRARPSEFAGCEEMARFVGFGASRLGSGLRRYYHAAPLELLAAARVEHAKRGLLHSATGVANAGADAGFATSSAFYENFGRLVGMPPAAYRALAGATEFQLSLPQPYAFGALERYLGRDADDPTLRRSGSTFQFALDGSRPSPVTFRLEAGRASARVEAGEAPRARDAMARMFGLNQDPRSLDAAIATRPEYARLAEDEAGLRVFQTPTVFEAIAWAIVGQQLTVRFAMTLRRRLFELLDAPSADGVYPPLSPAAVALLEPARLRALQFSTRKAEYLVGVARKFVSEGVDPEDLRGWPATRAEGWLGSARGFGPWSTNYVMMRGCGFADCVPVGDTGLTSGLQRLLELPERPDPAETLRLMRPFEPHRSLATFRIWFSRRLWAEEKEFA